jgi:hypothetical protein
MDMAANTNPLQYVKVTVMRSSAPFFFERAAFNDDPGHILSGLFTEVLIAVATSHHLLAPLYAIYDPNSFIPEDFQTTMSRRAYYHNHAHLLNRLGTELLRRFAATPISALIVDTSELRWAAVLNAPGFEHTVLLEQKFVNIILADTPEGRLFGFVVFYHELAHLFRRWVSFALVLSEF